MVDLRPADLRSLTLLGRVVSLRYVDNLRAEFGPDVEVESEFAVVRDGGRAEAGVPLFWSPRASALVWWTGVYDLPTLDEPRTSTNQIQAGVVWRDWTRGAPVDAEVRVKTPATRGPLRVLGPAIHIDYDSDKWDTPDAYRHEFGGRVVVACEQGDVALWVVQGGSLRITRRGIEG